MAQRVVFSTTLAGELLVNEVEISFQWVPGLSSPQKAKNVQALHRAAAAIGLTPILEVSTKAPGLRGRHLSAFYMKVNHREVGEIPLECAFQSSKVFEHGGPFTDLLRVNPGEAKRDVRLRTSGRLVGFVYEGREWPLTPTTALYDWLYLTALFAYRDWAGALLTYAGFSDIEFNPLRSLNCQARSLALFLALRQRGLLEDSLTSPEGFIRLLRKHGYNPQQRRVPGKQQGGATSAEAVDPWA